MAAARCEVISASGGTRIYRSFISSDSSILRRRATGCECRPPQHVCPRTAPSIFTSSFGRGRRRAPIIRSTRRSVSSRNSRSTVCAFTTCTTTCGLCRDTRSRIAGTKPAVIDSGQPIRTCPTVGSARNSMSLMLCFSSSNTTCSRLRRARAQIVGSYPGDCDQGDGHAEQPLGSQSPAILRVATFRDDWLLWPYCPTSQPSRGCADHAT